MRELWRNEKQIKRIKAFCNQLQNAFMIYKSVDSYIVSEYNRYMVEGKSRENELSFMSKKYGWEYKEL